MNWKKVLKELEAKKEWDMAISFMQHTVEKFPNSIDAYLSLNYLIMNLLVEEKHDESKHDHYVFLAKKYFLESYTKFSDNSEFLFYIGKIACMSEWYFDITLENADAMIMKSMQLEPNNMVYKWSYYRSLDITDIKNLGLVFSYVTEILKKDSVVQKTLRAKGSLGEYLLGMLKYWAQEIIVLKQ